MRRFVLSGFGVLLGSSAALAASLDGRWGLSVEACGEPNGIEVVTIDTGDGTIGYYETLCTLRGLAAVGDFDNTWQALQVCSGEGETWTEKTVLGVFEPFEEAPDRLALIDMTNGFTAIYFRCE